MVRSPDMHADWYSRAAVARAWHVVLMVVVVTASNAADVCMRSH
jgi:hypothetical protein